MKYNLLQIVQRTLSSMDSDEVDTIDETQESEQIVLIAEEVFFDLINYEEWPHLQKISTLDGLSDVSFPHVMQLPETYRYINYIRYDVSDSGERDEYVNIHYKEPVEFLDLVLARNSLESNVETYSDKGDSQVNLYILNDKAPTYYTSFDDEYLTFDSYKSTQDTTLQSSKSLIVGEIVPPWSQDDQFVPDLPEHAFPLYLAQVKRASHLYLKQADSPHDQRKELQNISRLRRTKQRVDGGTYDERARKDFGRLSSPNSNRRKLGRR